MKVGGRRRITIPPDMAYGPRGAGGVIGPDETLVFVVDLIGVSSDSGAPVRAHGEHDRRDHREREGAVRQRAGGLAEGLAERVADERERARPDRRAEQAPGQEAAQAQAGGAGQERRDRADDPDEAPDEDRLRAVALVEALDARPAAAP